MSDREVGAMETTPRPRGVSYWETSREFLEAHVEPGDAEALTEALSNMRTMCVEWHGSAEKLTWEVKDGRVVISFPGSTSSVGWDGR